MYVVFVEELEAGQEPLHIARTLEQAFAQIVCRCGYSYRFEPADEDGWCLFLIDVERPERSPDPLHSTCIKPRDDHCDQHGLALDTKKAQEFVPATHDLNKLASKAKIRTNKADRELLRQLSGYTTWAGRYPIPLFPTGYDGPAVFSGSRRAFIARNGPLDHFVRACRANRSSPRRSDHLFQRLIECSARVDGLGWDFRLGLSLASECDTAPDTLEFLAVLSQLAAPPSIFA